MRARVQPKQADRFADGLKRAIQSNERATKANALSDAQAVTGIEIGAGATVEVRHPLKRQPKGWIITDCTGANNDVRRTTWNDTSISLIHGGAGTVTLNILIY
ncbi:MAG: hypothetical protein ABIL09_28600 [Gemmatimonadota bacterium]